MNKKTEVLLYPEEGIAGFPERLKELIGNETLKDFAESVSISTGGLRKYLPPAKSSPSFDKVVRVASARGVSLEWLCTGTGQKYVSESNKDSVLGDDFVLIDGYHTEVEDLETDKSLGEVRRQLAFRKKWLKWRGLNPDNLKIFFVRGGLDGGLISNSDTVMIDFSDKTISDGSFAIKLKSSTVIRHFSARLDGSFEVKVDKFGDSVERLASEDVDNVEVIGRAVWIGKDIS